MNNDQILCDGIIFFTYEIINFLSLVMNAQLVLFKFLYLAFSETFFP